MRSAKLAIAAVLFFSSGCDVFLHDVGGPGEGCRKDGTCDAGLICVKDICCIENAYSGCYSDGNIHWFDSCGNVGTLITRCAACATCKEDEQHVPACKTVQEYSAIQCHLDGAAYYLDSCDNPGELAFHCDDEVERCVNLSEFKAGCQCLGNRDPTSDCQSCRAHWQDESNDCGTCPGNWDPDQDCDACVGNWVDAGDECGSCPENFDPATACTTCIGNWDLAANCLVCENAWHDVGDDCGTCPGNWDANANCGACIGNWDPTADCAACRNQWIDEDNDCGTCPGNWNAVTDCSTCRMNWDIATGCTECIGNWDEAGNCQICLPHFADQGDECGSCAGNWDPATNCATCSNQWIDENNACGTCPGNWNALAGCDGCRGHWDPTTGCVTCLTHWTDENNDCGTCPDNWDPGEDCSQCIEGYQDDDNNGTCELVCQPGQCEPSGICVGTSGSPVCLCDAGYQDNDSNLTCQPDCATASDCTGHGTCDDSTGQAVCTCNGNWMGEICDVCSDGFGGPSCATELTGLIWVPIQGGTFEMGSDLGIANEQPVHTVNVPNFSINRSEVTVTQYTQCVAAGGCTGATTGPSCNYGTGGGNQPIICITWQQASNFCAWANARLPSEAEREYAARSQGQDYRYPWGNQAPTPCVEANYSGCIGQPTNVCTFSPAGDTEQGLCDMVGSSWEYVQDCIHDNYDGAPTDGSAWEDNPDCFRVIRGGSWATSDWWTTNTRRHTNGNQADQWKGFRCAR
jgi:formylglycine-generating enzyme required for sulfatase activity